MDQLEHHRRCVLCVKHFTHPKATCANTPDKLSQSKATCANTSVKATPTATCANTLVKLSHSTATCANTPVKLGHSTAAYANHVIVCSAATDGQLVLWDVTMVLQTWLDSVLGCSIENDVCPIVPLCVVQCHQSGINDMDIKCLPGDEINCIP